MPKKSNRVKKACNQEVRVNNEEHRETKLFNSSSDEQYSLASDCLSLVDGINWEVEVRLNKEEVRKFVNFQARILVVGDANGHSSIEGLIADVEIDEKNLHWIVVENATSGGKFHDRLRIEINDVKSIEEMTKEPVPTIPKNVEKRAPSIRRASTTSGYDSHSSPRASRSSAATPTRMDHPNPSRSRSQDATKVRVLSRSNSGSQFHNSYAAALKGQSEKRSEVTLMYPDLKESSFPPLISNEDSIAVKVGESINTPLKPAILRPATPKMAPQEPQVQVPEIMVTKTNNDAVRKIYPTLPAEEMTVVPIFKVNEPVVHFVPPPPTFLPKWEESIQGQPTGNGKPRKFSRRTELCSYFIKYAYRRLDKERGDAINGRREPDFHYAILRACDLAEMDVNENEVRGIKIGHDTNLMNEEVLEGIFHVIYLLPSTKVAPHHQTTELQDFEANRPSMMIKDPKTGLLLYPIKFTETGFVDELYLMALWKKFSPDIAFQLWMEMHQINKFLVEHELHTRTPDCFAQIESSAFKEQLRYDWEKDFVKADIQFLPWYQKTVGRPRSPINNNFLTIPPPSHSGQSQGYFSRPAESSGPSPDTSRSSSSASEGQYHLHPKQWPIEMSTKPSAPPAIPVQHEGNVNRPELMEEKLKAYKTIIGAAANEQPALQEMFTNWTKELCPLSFQDFVAKRKMDQLQPPTSMELSLSDRLRRMVINPEANPDSYQSLQSSSGSEVEYVESGLTDLSTKTVEEWDYFNRRMCLRLPTTVSDEITQSIMIEGNMREGVGLDIVSSITCHDFLPGGRFAHIFIPNYVYIPPEISAIVNFTYERLHNHYFIIWRRLYAARWEAQKFLRSNYKQHLENVPEAATCPWIQLLLNQDVVKTFPFEDIDIIQMAEAVKSIPGQKVHILRNRQFYDRFLRPLERLFALDMPLRDRLFYAMEDVDATEDLTAIVLQLVGIRLLPLNLAPRFVTEEFSRIRHLRAEDFIVRSMMDSPIQLVNQVTLKASHQRRYKHESDRVDAKRILKQLGKDAEINGTFQGNMEDYFQVLNEAIVDCRESMEVIRKQIQENYSLVSRTTSESDKKDCLENIAVLKDRQMQNEAAYNKQWRTYEDLLHKKVKNLSSSSDDGLPTDVEMISSSKSVLGSYLTSWKVRRQELSKEKVGISVCLTNVSQTKKNTPTLQDIEYRKTLLQRQVEIDSQISELSEKIQLGEDKYQKLKPDPHPQLKELDDWCEDNSEDYWNSHYPQVPANQVSSQQPKAQSQQTQRRKIAPSLPAPPPSWQKREKPTWNDSNTFRRNATTSQVYLPNPYSKKQTLFAPHPTPTPPVPPKPQVHHGVPERFMPTRLQPIQAATKSTSVSSVDNWPKKAAIQRKSALVWLPLPFHQLPTSLSLWDGKNVKTAPKWATRSNSILNVSNHVENFTTKLDVTSTEDHFLLKIASANGVNFETRLEIKMGLNQATMLPDIVVIYETSTDRMTGFKNVGTTPFPAFHLMQILLAMEDLMAKEFPPLTEDRNLTEMTLFKTDFTEFSGAKITFQMQLQVVSIVGMMGMERMVRLKQMDQSRDNIVQFPWIHLPRIQKLWWNFYEDSKMQTIESRKNSVIRRQ